MEICAAGRYLLKLEGTHGQPLSAPIPHDYSKQWPDVNSQEKRSSYCYILSYNERKHDSNIVKLKNITVNRRNDQFLTFLHCKKLMQMAWKGKIYT